MIAPQSLVRTAVSPISSRTDSGRASPSNENSLAGNLSGVSVTPLQFPGSSAVDSDSVLHFSQSSANGQPLGEVNKAKHMEVFFTSLQKHGARIGNLEKLTQVMNHGYGRDLKNSTIEQGTKVALALFNAVPADMQDKALIGKATAFYQAMDNFSQSPGSTEKKNSAYKALKTLTSALSEKLGLSGENNKSDNLTKFCADYLKKDVCSDIISKLEGKLSPGILEGLRKNPEGAVEYLYDGQNTTNNNTIDTLKAQFAQHTKKGDKVMVMYSLLAALEQKTQIIAGLMPDIATPDAPSSPVDGIAVDQDIAQPAPANGNNTAKPEPVAPNITNITTTNNYYYGSPPSTRTYISTETINISGTETTTKPENNQPQSATASQTQADMTDSSTQAFDEVDSASASPDNLKPATSASTSATNKSLNSSGTLFGMKGPTPSWLGKDAKVSLTNDGLVRDLSRKQSYGQDGVEKKQPASLNSFGNQFVGFGQQNPAPAPIRGADKAEQDAPQVNNTSGLSTARDIPVSDNALNSDKTPEDTDGIYHAVPAMAEADEPLNSAKTVADTEDTVSSSRDKSGSEVILTRGGQARDLSRKQAYGLGDSPSKQPTSVNAQGTLFAGMGKSDAVTTSSRSIGETRQVRQDAPQVSYKADLLVPGKEPNFMTTLDIQVNSDGTLQQTADDTYRATPAKVVAEKHLNAQGTSFGMKVEAASASTQSGLANHDSVVTLTQQGAQTRELSSKLAYRLGGSQPKSSTSVNAQGNQFVGVGKNPSIPELTQSWINNKGANVVLTQEGAQTRVLTEKDRYRTDKFTNSQQPNNPSEAK
ncbi:hypothetical protein [Yersinia proxima]|uniref:hypothetical protein n=1 Tax=Yersinia proxima TaxID=2890316 RepID=UPI001D0F6CD1|nr:hypothetical protein [Yersinia proxima]